MNLSKKETIMLTLIAKGPMTGRDLAKALERHTGKSIGYATVYITMRNLKDAGLVTHQDDWDDDGRVRTFFLTEAGRKITR